MDLESLHIIWAWDSSQESSNSYYWIQNQIQASNTSYAISHSILPCTTSLQYASYRNLCCTSHRTLEQISPDNARAKLQTTIKSKLLFSGWHSLLSTINYRGQPWTIMVRFYITMLQFHKTWSSAVFMYSRNGWKITYHLKATFNNKGQCSNI